MNWVAYDEEAAAVLWVLLVFAYFVAYWLCGETAARVWVVEKYLGRRDDWMARRALLDVDCLIDNILGRQGTSARPLGGEQEGRGDEQNGQARRCEKQMQVN